MLVYEYIYIYIYCVFVFVFFPLLRISMESTVMQVNAAVVTQSKKTNSVRNDTLVNIAKAVERIATQLK